MKMNKTRWIVMGSMLVMLAVQSLPEPIGSSQSGYHQTVLFFLFFIGYLLWLFAGRGEKSQKVVRLVAISLAILWILSALALVTML